ncbi:fumarylacetoacetate hydrolase [Coprinopsis cinerea okayama7|uniref:Fumarylacetoacetate hydrolase n=1 Tax=Coprinopsis cinerea (strain Okayama-7 / 130 / ATCC MYA-4618 / FGSC 9003) TaxID=240176 RepID=D6RPH8_COPC7|nr:fumarylacetoacetate hydrolase [Coprinopsis cinerea okayama7\|eukprot:XP_002910530.1 fumarylacetoacetate hydrolase [Coprinopsis cinerea okayama7\
MSTFLQTGKKVSEPRANFYESVRSRFYACKTWGPGCERERTGGRNYVAHANELNNAVPKAPFFFLKPTSSYLPSGGKVEIPQGVVAHHEGKSNYALHSVH